MVEVLRGFKQRLVLSNELTWLFIALVISVTALTSVNFLADRLRQSFTKNAHELIAADAIVRADRPIAPEILKQAKVFGLNQAQTTIFSTMMRSGKQSKLVSLKGVTDQYPLRGQLSLSQNGQKLQPGQVWLEEQLANALQLQIGDKVYFGDQQFEVSNFILKEPDRGAAFMNFAPRAMILEQDLPATQLLGIGSRAVYRLMVAAKDAEKDPPSSKQVTEFTDWVSTYLQSKKIKGVTIEGIENGQPLLRKTIDQANRFLSLVALLTGMIAAVGIALATRRYVKKQVISTAVWRCLGASNLQILKKHAQIFFLLMLLASFFGISLGYLLQEVLIQIMQGILEKKLPAPSSWPILWGILVSVILLLGFALPPLLALTKVSPMMVMRKENIHISFNAVLTACLGLFSYAALLLLVAQNPKLSAIVLGAFFAACLVFVISSFYLARWFGKFIGGVKSKVNGLSFVGQRIAGNPGWISFQISALGVAMLAILLLMVVRFNVLESWQASVPVGANNRFILNVLPDQKDSVEQMLRQQLTNPDFDSYPMIRGRLIKINDKEVISTDFADENTQRLIEREFNLSYTQSIPVKNKIVAGQWFEPNHLEQVSMEAGMMKSLKLHLGDSLSFDVAGQVYTVQITSVRKLDWNSMRVNFFAIMPSGLLKDAPQSWIMAFYQDKSQRIDLDIVDRFPNITAINIQDSISQAQEILGQLFFAIQVLFIFTLLAGFVVLIIALISTQEQRMKEVAILKTLGANQTFLLRVWLFELLFCGGAAGLLSGLFASVSGWYLANYQLEIEMSFPYWIIFIGLILGVLINGLASLFLKEKTFSISPVTLLKT